MSQPTRWMTRDFVATTPPGFLDVTAHQIERFEFRPYPAEGTAPSLFVLAQDADATLNLEANFETLAVDLLGVDGSASWSLTPVQLLGYEGLRGTTSGSVVGSGADAAGMTLVRGRGGRVWAFGWRSAARDQARTEMAYGGLMQGIQARMDRTSDDMLQMQFKGQQRVRSAMAEATEAGGSGGSSPGPTDPAWERRFAETMGEDDPAAAAPLMVEAIALVEEPYGEEPPLGASRIGGGPDLPPDAWPIDARGMRHPFLMQVDLAEVAAIRGSAPPLPAEGLLSFFVHDDALLVDIVYTPPGVPLQRHPMSEAIIEPSRAAMSIACDLALDAEAGPLPRTEGDIVEAELMADGTLRFANTSDPVWAVGEPGQEFEALSDYRWACVASARLRPKRTRSFDAAAAERRMDETGNGSLDDLYELHEEFEAAQTAPLHQFPLPQVHQMLGYARMEGHSDLREEAAGAAVSEGHADLGDPEGWIVLARLRAGSVTGREFWDVDDLVILAPVSDLAEQRWDRCVLLSG